MKSNQDIIRTDLHRYMNAGYTPMQAARQIRAMRPGKDWARIIDNVVASLTAADDTYQGIYAAHARMTAEYEQTTIRG